MRVIKAADTAIDDVAFSPDGRAVAAYVKYQGVFLWNLDAVPLSRVPVDPAENVYKGGLVFAPDGRSLAWLVEGARRIYDRDSRGTTTEKTFAAYRRVHDQALTLDGSQGLSLHGMPDYRLIGWRQVEGMWVQTWSHSTADKQVESLTLSADGSLFAMLTREALGEGWQNNPRQVEVREAATGTLRGTGEYRYKYGDKLLFSPDGRQLVGFNTMNLLVWPVPEVGNLGTPLLVRNTTRKQFTAMAYHPSGRHLYVTSNGDDAGNAKDATVHIFDTTSWTRAEQFTWKLGNLKAVAVSPDGTLAAAGSERGDLVIWDVDL